MQVLTQEWIYLSVIALQQDVSLRQQFTTEIPVYSPDLKCYINFIDETGTDCRNLVCKYEIQYERKATEKPLLFVRGERVSTIACTCMSMAGLMDVKTLTGTSDGDTFYSFVQTHFIPQLISYDGINPHSIVIMDNSRYSPCPWGREVHQDLGALIHFLPPYSPDFNPIEETFSKVKLSMKSIEKELVHTSDCEALLLLSFLQVTPEDCQAWICNCGIYI